MTERWLRTNEHEEATSALEAVAEWSERVERDIGYWRWVSLLYTTQFKASWF